MSQPIDYSDCDVNRLKAALNFEEYDRVPYLEVQVDIGNASTLLNKDFAANEFSFDDLVKLAGILHMDAVNFWRAPGFWSKWEKSSEGTQSYVDGVIKTREDLAQLQLPDKEGRMKETQSVIETVFNATAGTKIGVYPMILGPFLAMQCAMGHETFFCQMHDDFDMITDFMNALMPIARLDAQVLSQYDIPFVLIVDDIAMTTGLMVHKDFFKKYWFPWMKYVLEPFKDHHIPALLHCCGKLDEVIPMALELGFTGIQPIQVGCNDIYAIGEEVGDKLCLMGNMDIAGVLAFGSPEQVREDTREHILRLGNMGGYIASSSHSIIDDIPTENLLAMVDTVLQYGKYPLQG